MKNKTLTENRANKIKTALHLTFQVESCDAKFDAQRNLAKVGSRYATDDTLRYFSARILETRRLAHDTLFAVRSTVRGDKTGGRGCHRFTVFDLTGNSVVDFDGPNGDNVTKQFYAWFETFDIFAHYRETLQLRANHLRREAAEIGKALR